MRRTVGLAVIACCLLVAPASAGAAPVLPDLGMARVSDLKVERAPGGRRLLRYTSTVVNVGRGRFQLEGWRSSAANPNMTVVQRVFDTDGSYTDLSTPTTMFFAGDGHNHWHVSALETSTLVRMDNGAKVGTGGKRGFCFFDNVKFRTSLLGAPPSPVYTGCGNSGDLSVEMGLSIGWGDAYYWSLPDQYIDITGLGAGRYRLNLAADDQNYFAESNDSNNTTWVDLQLKGNASLKVTAYGPAA